jgi:D-alanyl-D-alanine carboxypeptidase (penicillin-binding protein 5/6)
VKCIDKIPIYCCVILSAVSLCTGCKGKTEPIIAEYEHENYNRNLYEGRLYAEDLCVSSGNVEIEGFAGDVSLHAAALFDVNKCQVDYAYNMHEKLYPASTTKILTALVALKSCSVDEVVTVSASAAAASFPADASVCGLREGDRLTMGALLYGLLLESGNDNAAAIAEYVGGDIEGFAAMMNAQAKELRAVNTNFTTPHGLHDENHYTTAYDLYLIFNECIKYEEFVNIIRVSSYTADITDAGGTVRQENWEPTSFYARGEAELPHGASVIGGKTGYTGEAGNCLVLLNQDNGGNSYISIVMGADSKPLLYEDMSAIINQIPNIQ